MNAAARPVFTSQELRRECVASSSNVSVASAELPEPVAAVPVNISKHESMCSSRQAGMRLAPSLSLDDLSQPPRLQLRVLIVAA